MPLEEALFKPDVIVIVCKPRQAFDIIRANAYQNGEHLESSAGGTQSFCGDIVVGTYLFGKAHISFGCMGSHLTTEFDDVEVVLKFYMLIGRICKFPGYCCKANKELIFLLAVN